MHSGTNGRQTRTNLYVPVHNIIYRCTPQRLAVDVVWMHTPILLSWKNAGHPVTLLYEGEEEKVCVTLGEP